MNSQGVVASRSGGEGSRLEAQVEQMHLPGSLVAKILSSEDSPSFWAVDEIGTVSGCKSFFPES